MKNKKIGIPGWMIEGKYFGVGISYIDFISKFGTPVIITPQDYLNPPDVDMLYLPGGLDVNPMAYGAVPSYRTQNPNLMLEFFENKTLPYYIETKTPIFAVCRSAQYLWAIYGGILEQHEPYHEQSSYQTHQCHTLSFNINYSHLSKDIKKVNSRHHQMMYERENNENLIAVAYAKEDKTTTDIVEIWTHANLPIVGVQFHPEDHDGTDELIPKIILEMLEKSSNFVL